MDFTQKMMAKTNEELLTILERRSKYVPEAIAAAVHELRKRGHALSDEETQGMQESASSRETSNIPDSNDLVYSDDMAIFPESTLPRYYSKQAILGFSFLISTLFGAVLMAINLKEKRQHVIMIVVFGLLYTAGIFYLVSIVPNVNSVIGSILNGLGGMILTELFWPKLIGSKTKFTPKPVWGPLIIAAVLTLLYFLLMYVAAAENQ